MGSFSEGIFWKLKAEEGRNTSILQTKILFNVAHNSVDVSGCPSCLDYVEQLTVFWKE